jgi:hypothetical protein
MKIPRRFALVVCTCIVWSLVAYSGEAPETELKATAVAAFKNRLAFVVKQGTKVRFESTFTNVLNHTNFAPPATQIDNPAFGVLSAPPTAENAGNRTGQVALRVEF